MLSIEIICLLATLLGIAYVWCRYTYGYWQRQGLPFIKPIPVLGNTKVIFTRSTNFFVHISEMYKDSKVAKTAAFGIYILNRPALVLREPELIKSVLIKEFQKFANRLGSVDPHGDALGANSILLARTPKWRELRLKFTPVYTAAKVKQMYLLMREIAFDLESHLTKQGKSFVTDVKEVCALFTTDLIATTAFGVKANSLENPNGEFRTHGRKLMDFSLERAFTALIIFFFPEWASTFKVKLFTPEFSDFLRDSIDDVMAAREKSGGIRNDLIDVLVEMKKELAAKGQYDNAARDMLVAQAGIFFAAGFDTASATMSFALYQLAKHQDIQERLRNEICEAFAAENGKLSYETITTLPYLSMVIDETLRMHPISPILGRVHLPNDGEKPFDLKPYYDFTLPKDMAIYIPIYGLQRDTKYWHNPESFDPERFSPENKKVHEPMAYLPFGTGPRNCLGNRIGLLQSKLGLAHILKYYCVKVCDQTPTELKFDPSSFLLSHEGGIYLNFLNDGLYESKAN